MRIRVSPGASLEGAVRVPGDKSIAHRWLLLAATARGTSRLRGLPGSLDVRSTAACLSALTGTARPSLDLWARNGPPTVETAGSTWNEEGRIASDPMLEVEGEGHSGLRPPTAPLDCGNSGTSMRLLTGVLAGVPFRSVLTGDASLSSRPMERVAEPLRRMGASIGTTDGHAPLTIEGARLDGIRYEVPVASAQVKGAVLLAGLAADGQTTVVEPAPTRDHTERALIALGASVEVDGPAVTVSRFQHEAFEGSVPGDPSSAAFLVVAAALTGSSLSVDGVGLNPTRLHFLAVLDRMGVRTVTEVTHHQLGEPVGRLSVTPVSTLRGTTIEAEELPLVIDEVPAIAALAAHAGGDTRFRRAGELRVKESDRLAAVAGGLRSLGGSADERGDDLLIGGGGLHGGFATAHGDHRMAMSFAVAALAADAPCEIDGMEAADVSFPGFVHVLRGLGAGFEELG